MNIKTLSVSLTALCLSAAAPAADMLLENYGSSRPTWLSKLKNLTAARTANSASSKSAIHTPPATFSPNNCACASSKNGATAA